MQLMGRLSNLSPYIIGGVAIALVVGLIVLTLTRLGLVFGKKAENFTTSNKEIVFFSMKGCGHCEEFQPIWDLFVSNYGNYEFVELKQVKYDEKPKIVKQYNVQGFPTILGLENGEKVREFSGARTYENLITFLNEMS